MKTNWLKIIRDLLKKFVMLKLVSVGYLSDHLRALVILDSSQLYSNTLPVTSKDIPASISNYIVIPDRSIPNIHPRTVCMTVWTDISCKRSLKYHCVVPDTRYLLFALINWNYEISSLIWSKYIKSFIELYKRKN